MPSTQLTDNKTPVDSAVTLSSAADSKINVTSQPHNSEGHTSTVQSAPIPYHTRNDCIFSQVHVVEDLIVFQEWLQQGLTIKVDLQKVTYARDVASLSRPSSKKADKV